MGIITSFSLHLLYNARGLRQNDVSDYRGFERYVKRDKILTFLIYCYGMIEATMSTIDIEINGASREEEILSDGMYRGYA
ncbi:MAG: hypothetical protein CSA35_09640 [Dethiosulfovibrio peptidovorans]|nr:MAG: hypothetical protein CSA35_09640 [Dethiosulfovibrio peptidovorans]